MTKYEAIVFDMDGTLALSKSPPDKEMSGLLIDLLEFYKVAIISGGRFAQFEKQLLAHLDTDISKLKNLYILPTMGTVFCTFGGTWKCEAIYTLTEEEKQRIRDAIHKSLEEVGLEKPAEIYGEQIEDRGSQITFSALGQDAPLAVKKEWDPEYDKRKRITKVLRKYLPDFSTSFGGLTSIDITRSGIDKAFGVKNFMERLNVSRDQILFIGDQLEPFGNDEPVLSLGIKAKQVNDPAETKVIIHHLLEQTEV